MSRQELQADWKLLITGSNAAVGVFSNCICALLPTESMMSWWKRHGWSLMFVATKLCWFLAGII